MGKTLNFEWLGVGGCGQGMTRNFHTLPGRKFKASPAAVQSGTNHKMKI